MNKELSPLEALNNLVDYLEDEHLGSSESERVVERKHVIESALKDYEQYEKILKDYDFNLANFREACFTLAQFRGEGFTGIEKKLKALELIKNKKINVRCLMSGWHLGNYNSYKAHIRLTEEEYELLKEVLK